jgi:LmbE family N-acetylglucosaminyl deacetylase
MEEVHPDTVLTFGPDGMTGHSDHIRAGLWATEAFGQLAHGWGSLHYATHTPGWLARFREPLDELNVFMGAEPPVTPADELSINEQLNGDLLDVKQRAIRCMTSQVEPLLGALGDGFLREGLAEEAFRPA